MGATSVEHFGGLCSIGFTLQLVYTLLYLQTTAKYSEQIKLPYSRDVRINQILFKMVQMLSENPARMMGIDHLKGSIAVGKHADFVVWDNDQIIEINETRFKNCPNYAEMHVLSDRELYGRVERTYIRGECIYNRASVDDIAHTAQFIRNKKYEAT